MNLYMSGLEHSLVSIEMRERLSFTKAQAGQICRKVMQQENVEGCVLISTCNRTEIYINGTCPLDAGKLLCRAAGADYAAYADAFRSCRNRKVLEHLMEVASGLRSRIWGEDQILTQVKNAIALAREAGTADPILETLFRTAVAAGKEVRTQVRLTALPVSAASMAAEKLSAVLGGLEGRTALVIGNGEMGRLSAELLRQAGCRVAVTLRSYRHGETVVPSGCSTVSYEERFSAMEGRDIVLSATTSPHYTVTLPQFLEVCRPPRVMMDLAIPRDLDPELGKLPGLTLYNIDDLGDYTAQRTVPPEVEEIFYTYRENFYRWLHYRQCLPAKGSLKEAIVRRVQAMSPGLDDREMLIDLAVEKTVDLMLGGLAETVTPEQLARCESKIRAHTVLH